MPRTTNILAAVIVLSASATVALAGPNVAGKWLGRMKFDRKRMAQAIDAQAQASVKKDVKRIEGQTLALELAPGNTFQMEAPNGKSKEVVQGTWALAGNKITLTPTKKHGKPIEGGKAGAQILLVSRNGKQLTLVTMHQWATVTFTRKLGSRR